MSSIQPNYPSSGEEYDSGNDSDTSFTSFASIYSNSSEVSFDAVSIISAGSAGAIIDPTGELNPAGANPILALLAHINLPLTDEVNLQGIVAFHATIQGQIAQLQAELNTQAIL